MPAHGAARVSDIGKVEQTNDYATITAKAGNHEHEVSGVYQFKRRHSYVIFDDGGGEWEVQSMWQMKRS